MKYKYYKKQIAPRLLSGDSRMAFSCNFPPEIKEGLFAIARKEKKSVNWVMENVVIDYFDLKKPKYRIPGTSKEKQEKQTAKVIEMSLVRAKR